MTVEEGTLPVNPTDKRLDTAVIQQKDGQDAHREAVVLGDPELADYRAAMMRWGPHDHGRYDGMYAMAVTDYRMSVLESLLKEILVELRIGNQHLSIGSDEEITEGDIE